MNVDKEIKMAFEVLRERVFTAFLHASELGEDTTYLEMLRVLENFKIRFENVLVKRKKPSGGGNHN